MYLGYWMWLGLIFFYGKAGIIPVISLGLSNLLWRSKYVWVNCVGVIPFVYAYENALIVSGMHEECVYPVGTFLTIWYLYTIVEEKLFPDF